MIEHNEHSPKSLGSIKVDNSFSRLVTVNFSRETLCCGVNNLKQKKKKYY
jgi:hypothetical protein